VSGERRLITNKLELLILLAINIYPLTNPGMNLTRYGAMGRRE
jgi:hypothetical protein